MRAIFKMLLADCAASTNSRSLPANHTQANIDFPNVYETWLRNVFDLAWGIVSIVVVVHCVLSYCSIVCRRIFWLAANRELKSKMYTLEMQSQNAIGNIRFGNRIYTKCVWICINRFFSLLSIRNAFMFWYICSHIPKGLMWKWRKSLLKIACISADYIWYRKVFCHLLSGNDWLHISMWVLHWMPSHLLRSICLFVLIHRKWIRKFMDPFSFPLWNVHDLPHTHIAGISFLIPMLSTLYIVSVSRLECKKPV